MSGKLMGEVYKLDLPRAERDVLLAMADNANDDGGDCFPGVDLLAWKLSCSVRKVQYTLRALEIKGAILIINNQNGGRGRHPEYQIKLSGLPLKGAKTSIALSRKGCKNEQEKGANPDSSESERVQISDVKGADLDTKGAISDIKGAKTSIAYKEEPSVEPSVEPSGETPLPRTPIRKRKVETPLPEEFSVTSEMSEWARDKCETVGVVLDIGLQTEKFKNHAVSKDRRQVDWKASWRNWILLALEKGYGVRTLQNGIALGSLSASGAATAAKMENLRKDFVQR